MIKVTERCTACGACEQKCPNGCICLRENEEGFVYPVIDSIKCIECGLCEKVCPVHNEVHHEFKQEYYAAVNKDQNVLQNSTSGGVFYAIAESVIDKGGIVYGCAYKEHFQAAHIRVSSKDELIRLQGSKYVQSSINSSYISVKQDLIALKTVLFSGTPCQVAGLKCFLGKDYPNLLTVDIICHGVSPQAYFNKYIEQLEHENKVQLSSYSFRDKKNCGWSLAGTCNGASIINQKEFTKKIFYFTEYYYYYFLKGYIYRESCYICQYASLKRVSDFTLGDYWGIESEKLGKVFNNLGCSILIVNSEKGQSIIGDFNIFFKSVSPKTIIDHNAQLVSPTKKSKERSAIIHRLSHSSGEEEKKYFDNHFYKQRLIGKIKYLIKKLKMCLDIL